MIEKNIHFCWFGDKPISNKNLNNIEICKKINKDFNIKVLGNEILEQKDFKILWAVSNFLFKYFNLTSGKFYST